MTRDDWSTERAAGPVGEEGGRPARLPVNRIDHGASSNRPGRRSTAPFASKPPHDLGPTSASATQRSETADYFVAFMPCLLFSSSRRSSLKKTLPPACLAIVLRSSFLSLDSLASSRRGGFCFCVSCSHSGARYSQHAFTLSPPRPLSPFFRLSQTPFGVISLQCKYPFLAVV